MVGVDRDTDRHCLVFSFSSVRWHVGISSDMFPRSEGYVKSRGHWFGLAHTGGSELSNCVGGIMEEGDGERERGRKQGRERGRMGV